jgi:hypothetical protein
MRSMGKSMEALGIYMVLTFFAAQFVAFFNWTNLGLIFAVKGASFLEALDLGPLPLMIGFVLLTAVVNLVMGSASAKWAVMAPVFIPMFMLLGYSPELVQVAYRVGDSTTNIISPMMSYFALIVAFMERYDPKAGIGTVGGHHAALHRRLPHRVVDSPGRMDSAGSPRGPGRGPVPGNRGLRSGRMVEPTRPTHRARARAGARARDRAARE